MAVGGVRLVLDFQRSPVFIINKSNMNKIYQEPINKAESLIVGVKRCADSLAKKGIVINVDALSNACRALEDAGAAQDAAEVTADADNTVVLSEVTNMQQARALLMAEPYNCPLSQLQNKGAVKAAAQEKGVSFPNWL